MNYLFKQTYEVLQALFDYIETYVFNKIGAAGGLATLNEDGKVPNSQIGIEPMTQAEASEGVVEDGRLISPKVLATTIAEKVSPVAGEVEALDERTDNINERLKTVEQLAEISIGGGDIGIATAEDFDNPSAAQRAKVPTVGAILDCMDEVPTAGSVKPVQSGGVYNEIGMYTTSYHINAGAVHSSTKDRIICNLEIGEDIWIKSNYNAVLFTDNSSSAGDASIPSNTWYKHTLTSNITYLGFLNARSEDVRDVEVIVMAKANAILNNLINGLNEDVDSINDTVVKNTGKATYEYKKKVSNSGDIVASDAHFISEQIPCSNGSTIIWKYNSDQSVECLLEAFDSEGNKIGTPYSSANGSNGKRTLTISNKDGLSYIIATFADNDSYTPSIKIDGVLVWEKLGIFDAKDNYLEERIRGNSAAIEQNAAAISNLEKEVIPGNLAKIISFVGKGSNFSYSGDTISLQPGLSYTIRTPMVWDWTYGPTLTQYMLTVESYDSNDVKTILVGVSWGNIGGSSLRAAYDFVVPSDSAYIKVGGRASSGVVVPFLIYGKDDNYENYINSKLYQSAYANLRSKVKVIAHRGYHYNGVPENSIDAYRYAGYLGYDKAETDFCPTSDGQLVLMHDASINRTMRNASDYSSITETVNVNDKTLAELRSNYVLASSDVRYRRPIPTLEEYFKTCKESGVFPLPEIKTSGITNQYIKDAFDMGCRIVGEGNFGFCSADYASLDYVRTLSPTTLLYYIGAQIVDTVNSITGESRNSPYNIWYPQDKNATQAIINRHHEAGIRVALWTVVPSNYDKDVKMGCDEIATDNVAPNIEGLMTIVKTSTVDFNDFTTNGNVSNKILTLNAGNTLSYNAGISVFSGMYYLSIICKGDFTITGNHLSVTISNTDYERYVYKSLLFSNETPSFTIESNADNSTIEFVELYINRY